MVATAEAACIPTPDGVPVEASAVGVEEGAVSSAKSGETKAVEAKAVKTNMSKTLKSLVWC